MKNSEVFFIESVNYPGHYLHPGKKDGEYILLNGEKGAALWKSKLAADTFILKIARVGELKPVPASDILGEGEAKIISNP